MENLDLASFDALSLEELHLYARARNVIVEENARRQEVIKKVLQVHADAGGQIRAEGVLEAMSDGFGFIRRDVNFGMNGSDDIYVSQTQIKRFDLKTGDTVAGMVRPPKDSEKYYGLLRVEHVNHQNPETARHRYSFDELTPIYPHRTVPS